MANMIFSILIIIFMTIVDIASVFALYDFLCDKLKAKDKQQYILGGAFPTAFFGRYNYGPNFYVISVFRYVQQRLFCLPAHEHLVLE